MPEGLTWIEQSTFILELVDCHAIPIEVRIEAAKVMMLIALVEELRKTNAILKQMQRGK